MQDVKFVLIIKVFIQFLLNLYTVSELSADLTVSHPTIKRWREGSNGPHPALFPCLMKHAHRTLSEDQFKTLCDELMDKTNYNQCYDCGELRVKVGANQILEYAMALDKPPYLIFVCHECKEKRIKKEVIKEILD